MAHGDDRVLAGCISELEFSFVRASGPGGQNVNKVSTAVRLRFDIDRSRYLGQAAKNRLVGLAAKRLADNRVLTIEARRHRTQAQNREDALERFSKLIRAASTPTKRRHPTKPTAASSERRLQGKRRHSQAKRRRAPVSNDE